MSTLGAAIHSLTGTYKSPELIDTTSAGGDGSGAAAGAMGS